jgi:hypothetical protein
MISRSQMKTDLSGQAVLLILCLLLLLFGESAFDSVNWGLVFLLIWQVVSAAFYWRNYRYRERQPVFWLLLLTLVAVVIIDLSLISLLLVSLPIVLYLLLTLRDTLRVYRRPRSFWDLS